MKSSKKMKELYSEKFPFNGKKCFWPFPIIFIPLGAGNEFLFWDHQHQTYMVRTSSLSFAKLPNLAVNEPILNDSYFKTWKICVEMYVLPDVHTDGRRNISY